jgi:hypothetical protein
MRGLRLPLVFRSRDQGRALRLRPCPRGGPAHPGDVVRLRTGNNRRRAKALKQGGLCTRRRHGPTWAQEDASAAKIMDDISSAVDGLWDKPPGHALDFSAYVPGVWRCAKCGFILSQMVLIVSDCAVGVRDNPGEHCPNDGSPLWRVTQEQLDRINEEARRSW